MAKIKLGAIVSEIRGKLGGHVFSKNRAGAYMRTKVTPLNPQTTLQTYIRGIFASISSAWSSLTETQRESFRKKVGQYAGTDVFGDQKVLTGKALHHSLNQNLSLINQTLVTSCPNSAEVPFQRLSGAEVSVATGTIELYVDGYAAGNHLLVFGTPSMSQGTKFVKNKLRLLGHMLAVDPSDVDITTLYNDKFGSPVLGDNIYLGVKTVNSNGQASPMETIKLKVVA